MWATASVLLALFAAFGNAAASVLQRQAALQQTADAGGGRSVRLSGMLRQPVWLWGAGLLAVSGLCQAGALGLGRLAVVQPVMTTELLFTLLVAGRVMRRRPGARTWWSFAAMACGLAALLWLVAPAGGTTTSVPDRWLPVGAAVAALVALLCPASVRLPPAPRAAVLGTATALLFACTAALMKDAVGRLPEGPSAVLTSWQAYAAVAVGVGGFLLLQLTLSAGTLVASQPALTLGDAFLSVVLGAALFAETLHLGLRLVPELAALAVLTAGSIGLARSPAVSGSSGDSAW